MISLKEIHINLNTSVDRVFSGSVLKFLDKAVCQCRFCTNKRFNTSGRILFLLIISLCAGVEIRGAFIIIPLYYTGAGLKPNKRKGKGKRRKETKIQDPLCVV